MEQQQNTEAPQGAVPLDCKVREQVKSTGMKLLADAAKSNGGGVREERYADATVSRLLKLGLIQVKPGQKFKYCTLLTITKAGRELISNV